MQWKIAMGIWLLEESPDPGLANDIIRFGMFGAEIRARVAACPGSDALIAHGVQYHLHNSLASRRNGCEEQRATKAVKDAWAARIGPCSKCPQQETNRPFCFLCSTTSDVLFALLVFMAVF